MDGTHSVSDSSDLDSHKSVDLTNLEIIKPNTRGRKLRQKVSDHEIVDIDKIVKDDMPRYTKSKNWKMSYKPENQP